MPIELLWVLISIWLLILLLKRFILKNGIFESLLFLFFGGAFIASYFIDLTQFHDYITYAIYGGLGLTIVLFNPLEIMNKDRFLSKFQDLREEHKQLILRSESLRKRFIAMIDLLKDGLAFKSDDGMMFATDILLEIVGFENNEFAQIDYEARIHPEDLALYQNTSKKLTKKYSSYEISYRFKRFNTYVWIKEHGTLIHYEDRTMVIGIIKSIDVKRYPETAVEILNRLKIDHEMLEFLQSLNRQRNPYYIVFMELSNIPAINRKYGRDIGDLMMGEFLNKLRYNFVKEDKCYFRLSGIRFAMVIKDDRKYEIMERALKHGGDSLNFEMHFGGIQETVYPHFGIQKVSMFDEPMDEIIERTNKALDIALDTNSHENYFVIGK